MQRAIQAISAVVASVVLARTATSAVPPAPGLCAAIKTKAGGGRVAASMVCEARAARTGAVASFACLAATEARFDRLFAKADTKGPCGMAGDAATIGDSIAAFVEGMAAGLLPTGAPETVRHCAAVKMQRAGAYGRARLACWARAFASTSTALDPGCADAAKAKLSSGFDVAERKGSCATVGDVGAVRLAIDGFVDAIAGFLAPPATTTTSTLPTGSSGTSTSTTLVPGATTSTIVGGATTTSTIAPNAVSLTAQVQPIFTANCAVAGCHAGANPQQGLDLAAGHSYGNLVNVASAECPLFKRVAPGQPGSSYLVFKLAGPPQPCLSGNQMPGGSAPPLSTADQSTIAAWIAEGAPNN